MDWTETKSIIDKAEAEILGKLAEIYQPAEEKGSFYSHGGVRFHIVKMGKEDPWNCFVIEYSDTLEDGDQFYPADYDSLDRLVEKMIEEIDKGGQR
jgi:hypothetical protein